MAARSFGASSVASLAAPTSSRDPGVSCLRSRICTSLRCDASEPGSATVSSEGQPNPSTTRELALPAVPGRLLQNRRGRPAGSRVPERLRHSCGHRRSFACAARCRDLDMQVALLDGAAGPELGDNFVFADHVAFCGGEHTQKSSARPPNRTRWPSRQTWRPFKLNRNHPNLILPASIRGDATRWHGAHLSERFWIDCCFHDRRVHRQLGHTQAPPPPRVPPRPRRWAAAVATLVDLQDEYRAWLDSLPANLKDRDWRTSFKPLSSSTSTSYRQSTRHAATAVTDT